MGEYAEMVLDGTLCACGCAIDQSSDPGPGFPQYCSPQCERDYGGGPLLPAPALKGARTHPCPECGKKYRGPGAVKQHINDKHGRVAG